MAGNDSGSTGAQNHDEKKDHPRQDGRERGLDGENRYQDEWAERAEGRRANHSSGGGRTNQAEASSQPAKQDNTEPGGNRPKGAHHGRTDHK